MQILKFSHLSLSNLIKFLHINDNYPQYKNICIKNLRGKGGYLYEDNMWNFCNFSKLLLCLFKNKICDLEKILNNNSDKIKDYIINNIQKLIENYDEDSDTFIKNNKNNIINLLYNGTKNYKITK